MDIYVSIDITLHSCTQRRAQGYSEQDTFGNGKSQKQSMCTSAVELNRFAVVNISGSKKHNIRQRSMFWENIQCLIKNYISFKNESNANYSSIKYKIKNKVEAKI